MRTEATVMILLASARIVGRLCGLAALLAAQLAATSAAPTIVQGHYADASETTCASTSTPSIGNGGNCLISFTPVPAGELVVITSASCFMQITNTSGTSGLSQVYLESGTRTSGVAPGVGWFWLPPTTMATVTVRGQNVQQFQASAAAISKAYQAMEV